MRWTRIIILGVVLGLITAALVEADSTNNGYTCISTSVTSNSAPVGIMSPGRMTTFLIHVRSSPAADPVLLFPYVSTPVPTSVPSPAAVVERPSGSDFFDGVNCDQTSCVDAIGQGWAAVLAGGSTAITVDSCYR